jgi:Flp pilus assembly protein TadB
MMWAILAAVLGLGAFAYVARGKLGFRTSSDVAIRQSIRSMVAAQRDESAQSSRGAYAYTESGRSGTLDNEGENGAMTASDNRLTLEKRLKFAQLSSVPPYVFALAQIAIAVAAFLTARIWFFLGLQLMALGLGPLLVNGFINWRMNSRFKRFDRDYPQFLLSFVGMLKTGLNPMQALEACAANLEDNSLVRQEVELMLERLRLGVSEERSIGSFGEDINHPEIELFVQSLLLSRRVGGNLSEVVDRLARQVRKRQHFRASAMAAVGLQRGSIMFIMSILVSLELYLYIMWPECVITTWTDPTASGVAQGGLCLIFFGLWWVAQVTKIRV